MPRIESTIAPHLYCKRAIGLRIGKLQELIGAMLF
jgi:hypothetical protein